MSRCCSTPCAASRAAAAWSIRGSRTGWSSGERAAWRSSRAGSARCSALLAEGLSNRAIAERLVVTGRTVETHIGQIFLKLGLRDEGAEHRRVAAVLDLPRARGR